MRRCLTARGLAVPERRAILGIVGLSLHRVIATLLGPDVPQDEVEACVAGYKDAFRDLVADPAYASPLFPGAAATLDQLAAEDDLVLGIATGKSRNGVVRLVERFGWDRRFITIQTADDAPSKPDPTMVLQAAREAGVAPDAVYMIGDTTFDMDMAREAGSIGIGVSWGNHPVADLQRSGARWIIDSFEVLPALVGQGRVV